MEHVETKEAIISPCGNYRYFLSRKIGESKKTLTFIMLNPSRDDAIDDAIDDDPTIKRCVGFCQSLGYGTLHVVNLFAFRSPDPSELLNAEDPIGEENLKFVKNTVQNSDMTICAWGTNGSIKNQDKVILNLLGDFDLYALKITKYNFPSHPLYLSADLKPVLFQKKST